MSKASSRNLKNADPEKRNKGGGVSGVSKAWDKIGKLRASGDLESRPRRLLNKVADVMDAGLEEGDPAFFELMRRCGIGPRGMSSKKLEQLEN